jgi:hypothetical protein
MSKPRRGSKLRKDEQPIHYQPGRELTKHGDKRKYDADRRLRMWFGIPAFLKGGPDGFAGVEEYERRLAAQGGGCAVCGRPPKVGKRLCTDHNHKTGLKRGLICHICNGRILGRLERFKGHATLPQLTAYLQVYDPTNVLLQPTSVTEA